MRKIILAILGVVLVVIVSYLSYNLVQNKNRAKPTFKQLIKTVYVDEVKNQEIPITITASGNLTAKNKIDIFAEVQGIMRRSSTEFKSGTNYQRGQTLLSINSDEFYASLQSQKSNLYNLITAVMPDIRLDYPDEFVKWKNYLKSYDINKSTPKLPTLSSDKEKYFISGRGINTSYYNVKNLEVKLGKYRIRAPFKGILTEALVTPGSLVRVGQKLGEFIDPSIYELEVAISSAYSDLLKVGNKVSLHDLERTSNYSGKVIRVNGKIDQATQTIKVFISVKDADLREGMYLEADLVAKSEANAIQIPRKLLVDNKGVFIVQDSVLKLFPVDPVYFSAESAVIKGIPDETQIITQPVLGAYDGMPVKINKSN